LAPETARIIFPRDVPHGFCDTPDCNGLVFLLGQVAGCILRYRSLPERLDRVIVRANDYDFLVASSLLEAAAPVAISCGVGVDGVR
jgi:hypothetical protein